jgi:hypothetical protein
MWHSNLKKKHLFLDISSTNIDTLVPSLYQCVETRSIEVFWLLSATSAPPFQLFVMPPSCEPLYSTNTSHRKQETFLYEYPLQRVLLPAKKKKRTTQRSSSVKHPQARSPLWLLKPAPEHAPLLPRLSWSWTVLLPSDTHRKPITTITAVLLPFVTYLLTLPRIWKENYSRCY